MDYRTETMRYGRMTLEETLSGKPIPRTIRRSQTLLDVEHVDFNAKARDGQLVVHRALKRDVAEIFAKLYKMEFPMSKIIPIAHYEWDDNASMADNNTSAFNYRPIAGTNRLSNHAFGRAIDINPRLNPHITKDGKAFPPGAIYDPKKPGTITHDGPVVRLFNQYGFSWGGNWKTIKDYQHFEKI